MTDDPDVSVPLSDDDRRRLELKFHSAMVRGSKRLKKEIGYNPTRFMQMVAEHGGGETAKRLLTSSEPSEGFMKLAMAQRLHLTAEFHVLLPEYEPLFTDFERDEARARLQVHNFDIERHIRIRDELDV